MEPIFLMINEEAKRSYDQQIKMKRDRLDSAIKFCSQFVDITDEKEFSKGYVKYIDKKLRGQIADGNSPRPLLNVGRIGSKKMVEFVVALKGINDFANNKKKLFIFDFPC